MRHESFSTPAGRVVDIILAAFMRRESDSGLVGHASGIILATFPSHGSYSAFAGRVSETILEASCVMKASQGSQSTCLTTW